MNAKLFSAVLILLAGSAANAQKTVSAPLQSIPDRKPAPNFVLRDASGKSATLKEFQGKVVLLDFWATWCTGCKLEIPWFVEFQKTYGAKGFAVVGVSMDEGGWGVLKPFLAAHPVAYRMLLGDAPMAKNYGIQSLPDTFLIDREGRIAAVYREGLVDRADIETNIKTLLAKQ